MLISRRATHIITLLLLVIIHSCEHYDFVPNQHSKPNKTNHKQDNNTSICSWPIPFGHQVTDTTLNYFSYNGQQTLQIITIDGEHTGVLTLSESNNIGMVDFEICFLPEWKLSPEKNAIQVQSFNLPPLENETYLFDTHKGNACKFQLFEAAYYSIIVKTTPYETAESTLPL
jgi:hypothetical protein